MVRVIEYNTGQLENLFESLRETINKNVFFY